MRNYLFIICLGLFTASCSNVVDGLNSNPNYFQEASTQVLLNHASLNVASICEANPARLACMFTDQMQGTDRQYTSYNSYNVISKDFNEIWDDFFQSGITQANIAKKQAIQEADLINEGIALILESYYFGEAAALFGSIPYSQVNDFENFPSPAFEPQMLILEEIQKTLDRGIELSGDVEVAFAIFETNATWGQVAQALKARYYLLVKNYEQAYESAKQSFNSDSDGLYIKHHTSNFSENLFWQFEEEVRGGYLSFNQSYLQRLLTSSDPLYKGNDKTDETARLNYYVASDGVKYNTSDSGLFGIEKKFPVISYEEIKLIEAESAYRMDLDDEAMNALNEVRSMWSSKYEQLYDLYELTDFNTEDGLLLEILLEKYVSVIGLPTFYDVNRTNNYISVPIKNSTTNLIPQRFLYPETEAFSNKNFPGYQDLFEPTEINK